LINTGNPSKPQEGLFTAISIGFFLLLVGAIFISIPNLFGEILDFFGDFSVVPIHNTEIVFLGPENPDMHMTVYEAAGQFSIALAVFYVVMLVLRFVFPSSRGKRTETVGNIVYWAGAAYLTKLLLIESPQWFPFWSAIIIVVGISLITRAVFMAVSRI
jgi:hypothetical protein